MRNSGRPGLRCDPDARGTPVPRVSGPAGHQRVHARLRLALPAGDGGEWASSEFKQTSKNRAPQVGFPQLAAPRPNDPPMMGLEFYRSDAVRGVLNVTVATKTTALPSNFSLLTPRYGSCENVIITIDAGFCRCGARLRKSGTPYIVVRMKPWALGLTIMARSHGSLKRSPTRTTLGTLGVTVVAGGAATAGRSSLRLTATVVSAGAARDVPVPIGTARAAAIGVGCAA